jgi:hypothetical protein
MARFPFARSLCLFMVRRSRSLPSRLRHGLDVIVLVTDMGLREGTGYDDLCRIRRGV